METSSPNGRSTRRRPQLISRRKVLAAGASLPLIIHASSTWADDWAQWRGAGRDGDWNEKDLVTKFDSDSLKVLWKQEISSGYSGPTVSNGMVYVMDRKTDGEKNGQQSERVLCFDAKTGDSVWEREYDAPYVNVGYVAGPRASVTIDGEHAFAMGTMGHAHCYDAKTGEIIWARDLNADYKIVANKRMPIWGLAGSPLIHGDHVILHIGATEGASLVALDRKTGKEVWRALDDRAQYSSPVMTKQDGKEVLVCWTGDSVSGVNPTDGSVYWRHAFKPKNMPIGIATPVIKDNKIFLTSFYDGALMLEMSQTEMKVKEVWSACGPNEKNTKSLHSIISTPVWIDDHIYGVDSYGEFRCLKASDGERVWMDQTMVPKSRWSTAHFVQNGKQTWIFNERGELILSELSPEGYKEISRAKLIEPTKPQLRQRNGVCWSHPAYANRCVFLRNDREMICVSLAEAK